MAGGGGVGVAVVVVVSPVGLGPSAGNSSVSSLKSIFF
jgi:hypothetical protein